MSLQGILAAGNWIIDHIKIIDNWPEQDALANVQSQASRNGGSPYNLLKNLRAMGAHFPLSAAGTIGRDQNGQHILDDCRSASIDTSFLLQTPSMPTSYTDVMTVASSGRRTFFHNRGANQLFDGTQIDFAANKAKIFHLGYLLLLDALDAPGEDGLPKATQLLASARKAGRLTSVDVVSETSDRFSTIVPPVLPQVDVLFVNEYEASKITGMPLDLGDAEWQSQALSLALRLVEMGVGHWVVLHFPTGALARSAEGQCLWQNAVKVPQEHIKGASGAGDAFASGVLFGLHEGWPMEDCLRLGVATAASSLFDASCSDSILPVAQALDLLQKFGTVSW